MIEVPLVTNQSERDAEFDLNQVGLTLGEVYYEYDSYYLSGVVFAQSIDAGVEVVEGTPVDITVSLGRLPKEFIVPDVIGKSLEMAKRELRRAGLSVGHMTYEVDENLVPDTVIRQSIDPEKKVNRGYRIDLVLSKLESAF
jgi:beta-lactam-binding protein with PASTA domain